MSTSQTQPSPRIRHSQQSPRPSSSLRFLALFDYDGTLTTHECMEIVLQRLVGNAWRPFEREVRAGRLSHAEALRRQVGLIRAPAEEFIGALVAEASPASGLADFLGGLSAQGHRAAIVSAGFHAAIDAVWRREKLPPIEIHASRLVPGVDGGPPYGMAFDPLFADCPRCGAGQCKGGVLRALRRPHDTVLAFGDGSSDLCLARGADLTFARDHLAELCAAEQLPWLPLTDYGNVRTQLEQHFGESVPDGSPGF